MLLESVQIAEMLGEMKRRDLERAVVCQRLLAEIGAREANVHPRQMIAGALVRIATMLDAGAVTHTPAPAHRGES
jgi:hypothetical protein